MTDPGAALIAGRPRLQLLLLSALMLFVELALIRWSGSHVVYLSYFSNFVLLGSFLGIGIGFLRARARINLSYAAPAVLALFVAGVLVARIEIGRSGDQLIYFGGFEANGLPPWVVLPIVFVAVSTVMALIGEGVARVFARFEPLDAYRLDIAGSLIGIAAFTLLSFAGAPPIAWAVADRPPGGHPAGGLRACSVPRQRRHARTSCLPDHWTGRGVGRVRGDLVTERDGGPPGERRLPVPLSP